MRKPVYSYFACANSCQGFVNHFPSVLQDMNRIFILKGGPGTGKSTLMKGVGAYFENQDESVEYIYCSSDTTSLDGVILRSRGIAIVDGTAPHVIEPAVPGAVEEYVNLGVAWDAEKLIPYRMEIQELNGQIRREYQEVYRLLKDAKEVHDRWESIYRENMDFDKLNQAAEDMIAVIFEDHTASCREAKEVHRFFGALTPEGSINFIESLTQGMKRRYFIKGRPGTGKSTLMKKIAAAAKELGLDAEIYHCSLDADSLDMVILRGIGVCVFDATPPHEMFPSVDTDVIVDLYDAAVIPQTDEEHQEALSLIAAEYDRYIRTARVHLARARHLHDALEQYYINAVDYKQIDVILEDLILAIE